MNPQQLASFKALDDDVITKAGAQAHKTEYEAELENFQMTWDVTADDAKAVHMMIKSFLDDVCRNFNKSGNGDGATS